MKIKKKTCLAPCLSMLAACSGSISQPPGSGNPCLENGAYQFDQTLSCYRSAEAEKPLVFQRGEVTQLQGMEKRHYQLTSQRWESDGMVQAVEWKHDVDIYIPANTLSRQALLVSNNGINIATETDGTKPASDFTEAMLISIAQQTRTIVVSVSNVPNQYLTYLDDGVARREDSSVAHSWKLFLQAPHTRRFMSVHVPMMESMVKAMDLAEQELQPWQIRRFIVTGASKRGWASWLTAIVDPRVEAIVPFAADVLAMDTMLDHTYQTYGGNWPLAFADYYREGMTSQRKTARFAQLMQIEDPLRYLNGPFAARLAIPKYIVNASGDDFFVPDNTRAYLDQLPGVTALRIAPNSDHGGIRNVAETSLVPLINRMQHAVNLPTVTMTSSADSATAAATVVASSAYQLKFSEMPSRVTRWVANNPVARDFRYACGIRYQASELAAARSILLFDITPDSGWSASFVEAQFADGLVLTTPVRILPDTYPSVAPPAGGPTCKTIVP